jgi:outer membrane lipoprotein LolB
VRPTAGPLLQGLLALCLALAAGCAQMPADATGAAGPAAFTDWTLVGRIGIATDERSWSASLRWEQHGESYRLDLIAPLGQGTVRIEGSPGAGVSLRSSDGEQQWAADPETLLGQGLGWQVPVQGLQHWIKATADPSGGEVHSRRGPDGRLAHLRQSGWDIEYQGYTRAGDGELPSRLLLRTERAEVRIVVTRWELPSA